MSNFPSAGILPKHETLAHEFLQLNPNYDGRDVVVAILDTGVDPGAIGLQTTPQNKPKIIDIVDTTGSGDVETTTIRKLQADNTIEGLSGKKLKLHPEWKCPSGDYHVGIKLAYELYPRGLVERLQKERKEKWEAEQRKAISEVQQAISEWTSKNTSPTPSDIKRRNELKARLGLLEEYSKEFPDPGPVFDCVVFHDGEHWRAVIDCAETGDLSNLTPMTNYKVERQYATFCNESRMNYCVNIYDDGNLLCIVCDAGSHGTHVAGIVAAYHPNSPEINGIAPGAQIVAVKIGDSRLGSMETGVGLMRGFLAVLENKCDIINMSYGEYSSHHNHGRIVRFAEELVDKHGVIFISSAGNEGPALSSVGAPGGSSSAIIGVGAYVSPAMMEAEYSMRQQLPGIAYTWSSRGPTFDGDLGVNICAPGGAIAPVPNWTLKKNQLMNGTSMSSPNAAGNVALLLSGLKANKIQYSPYTIRRALENTAFNVPDVEVFAQGHGLIQTTPAFNYLMKYAQKEVKLLKYNIILPLRAEARGIYLREPIEVNSLVEVSVHIDPVFHEKEDNMTKIEYEMLANLSATQSWVSVANSLVLMNGGRSFNIAVNCKCLSPGSHYAEVVAYDSADVNRGPIFRVPITVIKPEPALVGQTSFKKSLQFHPGKISRTFLEVPSGATWVDITIRDASGSKEHHSHFFQLHALQTIPHSAQSSSSYKKYIRVSSASEDVYSFSVVARSTMEVCIAQNWSSLGESKIEVDIDFHGIFPDKNTMTLHGGEGFLKVNIRTDIADETIHPTFKLNKWQQKLRPESAVLSPLGARDALPNGRQVYQLILTYKVVQNEKGDIIPRFPLLNDVLYESEFESQLCMVFDENQKYIGTSDAYPKKIELKKGTYSVKLQVRHDDAKILERLKPMICLVERTIKDVVMPAYKSRADAVTGGSEFSSMILRRGKWRSIFISEPTSDKHPAGSTPGDILLGSAFFGKKNDQARGSGRKPGGFEIKYSIPPAEVKAKEPEPSPVKDERSESELADEAVRDLLIARLVKLEGKPEFDASFKPLCEKYPTHLPLLQSSLHHFDSSALRKSSLQQVVDAATKVIALIDVKELSAHYGVKLSPPDDPKLVKTRKEMDKKKSALIDALDRKCRALAALEMAADFDETFQELQKWADTAEDRFAPNCIYADAKEDRHALAIQRLNKLSVLENSVLTNITPANELHQMKINYVKALGWEHLVNIEERLRIARFPSSYTLF